MDLKITYPETPAGKRRIHVNLYGNIVGYVGNKRFWEFGTNCTSNMRVACAWNDGATLEAAQVAE